jgi:hypothetical protein
MNAEPVITDFDGAPVAVGTRVRAWDYAPDHPEWGQDAKYNGVVTDLGEFDGDVDDEGRSICVYPRVTVKFDSGDTESFVTCEWEYEGWAWDREPVSGKVEELAAITT